MELQNGRNGTSCIECLNPGDNDCLTYLLLLQLVLYLLN